MAATEERREEVDGDVGLLFYLRADILTTRESIVRKGVDWAGVGLEVLEGAWERNLGGVRW